MTLYSIFEREPVSALEVPVAVPEKFSWLAALLPPVFALVHGLWLELTGFVVAMVVIVLLSSWLGAEAGFCLYVLFALLLGFEAPALRAWALQRRGWHYSGEFFAADEDMAQIAWLKRGQRP